MSNGNEWENEAREELIADISEQVNIEKDILWELLMEEEFGISCRGDYDKFSVVDLMEIAKRLDEICG